VTLLLKDGVRLETVGDIRVYLAEGDLTDSDRKEIRFWRDSREEGPAADLFDSLRVKAPGLKAFEGLIPRLAVRPGMVCLEAGAGQAWPSLMLKRAVPGIVAHASELSVAALSSTAKWEGLIGQRLDGKWACSSRNLPFASEQFDRVFTYEAFHHFGVGGDFAPALRELLRVLRPDGRLVLLREPSAPGFLRDWQYRRLNRLRKVVGGADVDEDAVVPGRLADVARGLGARLEVAYETGWAFLDVGLVGVLGKAVVRAIPAVGRFVPCAVSLTIEKTPGAPGRAVG
jgi:SAM-dependent methyltransferase